MHLDPDPVHDAHDVFEPVQNYGVLLVLLFPLCDFLMTLNSLFLFFLFAALEKGLNVALLRIIKLILFVPIENVAMDEVLHEVQGIPIVLIVAVIVDAHLLFHF